MTVSHRCPVAFLQADPGEQKAFLEKEKIKKATNTNDKTCAGTSDTPILAAPWCKEHLLSLLA